ncbi:MULTISPECIES: LysR family transcriptional regulator [Streptomyces]|uniref:LysR family transcriptional regulator n=1 Tax=Streptomyces TaxID=1883 RepID=UPI00163B897D|nr:MULTISPECIES: LysR family transcriptional regulator [Streptomyces]MBC2876962.1 LysR family transcriptional regulator [Streptomyces sp. TYQ1024]UBI35988.1 LysR family transcriptional regulator [Streptomyces mobaraensis]UKW28581.1 LysR family transcriptional regulator [Streptomyces sp. TYQ1024]
MFDLHRLRLLRELKHRGTLAAVAAALSYSPSTVSQQLSQLEAEAGVRLLEPVGRRVRLTHQAEILVAHTEAVLERLERAQADIADSLADVAGTLRVAAFQTAALTLVPPALTLLRAAHPRLRPHVTESEPEDALPALLARDFDLVVTEEYPGGAIPLPAELDQEPLLADTLRLAAPHPAHSADSARPGPSAHPGPSVNPADGGPPTTLRSLAGHPWVMEPEGTAAHRWAVSLCRDAGFEPDVRFESSDLLLHLRLVEEGHAAAFLPDLIWNGRHPTVPLHPLPHARHTRRISTVVRRGRARHPAITACRAALRRAAEDLARPKG